MKRIGFFVTVLGLFSAPLGAWASESFAPFKIKDIKIEHGVFGPCLKMIPDRIQAPIANHIVTIFVKQTLVKPVSSCAGNDDPIKIVIHDGAGNELTSEFLTPPEDVGTTNNKPLLILRMPSDFKPPVTIKLRKAR